MTFEEWYQNVRLEHRMDFDMILLLDEHKELFEAAFEAGTASVFKRLADTVCPF